MLFNIPTQTNEDFATILSMETSPYEFFFTGSRFFGTATEKSDYDFFVEKDKGVFEELKRMGFNPDPNSTYNDTAVTSIWKKGNIHVQIVVSAKTKQEAQKILKDLNIMHKCDKKTKKQLWNSALKLAVWKLL